MGVTAVVMPVGPDTKLAFLRDSLESVRHYMPEAHIIAVNDTGATTVEAAADGLDVDWVRSGRRGTGVESGSLHTVLCLGYARAADIEDLTVMMKMDTDALIVGSAPDSDAEVHFAQHPHLGLIGSYRRTCTGAVRDFGPAAHMIAEATRRRRRLYSPAARRVASILTAAKRHGYEAGEHVLGGASFLSGPALRSLAAEGLLTDARLGQVRVVEDHMLPLCVRALGFELGDFATGDHPLALAWRGLPWTPEQVAARPAKKVVHSVSDWGAQRETSVRAFFAGRRQEATQR